MAFFVSSFSWCGAAWADMIDVVSGRGYSCQYYLNFANNFLTLALDITPVRNKLSYNLYDRNYEWDKLGNF